jgi:acyl-CoA synthetase (AMP-forming)/AMP-acid ligase II
MARIAKIKTVLVDDDVLSLIPECPGVTFRTFHSLVESRRSPRVGEPALVQFSSGTTGEPKGVHLSSGAILANCRGVAEAVGADSGDCIVSWLPWSHDMGLIGTLLSGLVAASHTSHGRMVFMSPMHFLARPGRWLSAIGEFRGTISAAPAFGLRLAASSGISRGVDLTSLRCIIVGGEPIRGVLLRKFEREFAEAGLRDTALCPAYGLAEASLAVTISSPGTGWRSTVLARHSVPGIDGDSSDSSEQVELVHLGRPVADMEVAIADDGHVLIRGSSMFSGYLGDGGHEGWFDTHDLGVVRHDELLIAGRSDDLLTVAGRQVLAQAIEEVAFAALRVECLAVAFVDDEGRVALALEWPERLVAQRPDCRELLATLRGPVLERTGVMLARVQMAPRGSIPRTASGKPRRLLAAWALRDM